MHEIPLNLVKPSPNPIRKTWDEQKMQELAQSIKEQGVIVPIKVRPPDDIAPCRYHGWGGVDGEGSAYDRSTGYSCEGCLEAWTDSDSENIAELVEDGFDPFYKVVYGHRRVEAARRAGLDGIPAIVEGVEDNTSRSQSLTENVVREDMLPIQVAAVLQEEKTRDRLTNEQIGNRYGMTELKVQHLLRMLRPDIKSAIEASPVTLGPGHVEAASIAASEAGIVLKKAGEEDLTKRETHSVARAVRAADTPELKQAILETSGKLGDADRITQVAEMKVAGRNVADGQEVRREKAFQEFDSAVKDFLDMVKMFTRTITITITAAKYGKFSPEAKRYSIRRIDKAIEELETLKEALSNG